MFFDAQFFLLQANFFTEIYCSKEVHKGVCARKERTLSA
jgi:hypothetical protein